MNLVWHIVKKDFTRLRLPLLLWTCVQLGQIAFSERMFSSASLDGEWFNGQWALLVGLTFLELTVCYIMVAALVLEDPLVGTQMFWVTRPVSGGRLLAAKLVGAAVFFILWPVLVGLPWWLYCGFGLHDIGPAAVQTMELKAVIVVPVLMLAALTGQSSRFLLWSLVACVAVPVGTGLVAYYLPKDLPKELITTKVMLACGVGFVSTCTVIWLQYRSRRLVRSIGVTVAGAVVAVLVGLFWSRDLTGLWPKDTSQLPGTEHITIRFGEARVQTKDDKAWVTLFFLARDLPVGLTILSGEAEVDFHWADGETLQRRGQLGPINPDFTARHLFNLSPPRLDPASEQKRKEMHDDYERKMIERGYPWAKAEPAEGVQLIFTADVPSALAAKFAAEPPACTLTMRLTTGQGKLLLEMPLKEGATMTANGVRVRLLKIETVAAPSPDKPANQRVVTGIHSQPVDMKWVQFLLVDRTHGTVTMEGASLISVFPVSALPVRVNRSVLRLNIPQLWRNDQWVNAPGWLEADTLAAVCYPPNGGFNRTLKTDRLEFVKK